MASYRSLLVWFVRDLTRSVRPLVEGCCCYFQDLGTLAAIRLPIGVLQVSSRDSTNYVVDVRLYLRSIVSTMSRTRSRRFSYVFYY